LTLPKGYDSDTAVVIFLILDFARVGGFHIINFHEKLLGGIELDASSRKAGQDSGKCT
jgi:hypothetical protein